MLDFNDTNQFRELNEFPGYGVGADGSLWTRRGVGRERQMRAVWRPGTITTAWATGNDYLVGKLHIGGKTYVKRMHRLVLFAFVGPCPPGMEGCHNDGNHQNNALSNLRWDTPSANQRDRAKHGTSNQGSRHGMAKLDEGKVRQIRELHATGRFLYREIAAMFGVGDCIIGQIVRREVWRHVS
jgi:hypothetical protein